jgi:hypothetical protein
MSVILILKQLTSLCSLDKSQLVVIYFSFYILVDVIHYYNVGNVIARLDVVAHSVIPVTQGVEIGRTVVLRLAKQKVSKTPISTNKLSVVVHTCDTS